jgi:hypothetical protein
MIPRHLGYEFVILAIACTVAIFVFPAASGPYAVVHGPVTALLSLRVRLRLWLAMALAALQLLERLIPINFVLCAARQTLPPSKSDTPEQITILRC